VHKPKKKLEPIDLGDLPVEALAKHGIDLKPGRVKFSIPAQKHAIRRHRDDYPLCEPHLSTAVESPTHVGGSPHHHDAGIELIVHLEEITVLVAIGMEPDGDGNYPAKSTYPIGTDTLDRRVRKKFLTKIR